MDNGHSITDKLDHAFSIFFEYIGSGDDGIGSILGLLSTGKLDLSGDAVEVTTDLAPQSPATIGIPLCKLQTLKCLKFNVKVKSTTALYTESIPEEPSLQHLQLLQPSQILP